ncbi:SAF domain-containing protein [Serinicoccus sp. CNJ-927]|uniref:SAF domain-containing protein n=1 Tax=Serinicoccus sp. CNJ-927 TaxID=1904970 RepID=UPI001EDC3D15|nr:SAF domain-containing protein [Serinicoccus sp. CNJ-927]
MTAPPKLRRRPIQVLLALALVIAGALLAVWAWSAATDNVSVVALRETVPRGSQIGAEDLMVVQVNSDPALRTVPGDQLESFVGQRAGLDLSAGTLLSPDVVVEEVVPGAGQSVVGLALAPGSLPGEPLQVGDRVRVVGTAGQGDPAQVSDPVEIPAEVANFSVSETGQVILSVVLDETRAGEAATWAAAGRVAVILDSSED